MSRWRREDTCTGGWREMAAIFPTGSSPEPIAFLQRALRRQLWLKNCLCHVRHIFLAFPLFSSLAARVPGLLYLRRSRGQPLFSSSTWSFRLASSSPLPVPSPRRRRFASLIFFVHPTPSLHPSSTYSSSFSSFFSSNFFSSLSFPFFLFFLFFFFALRSPLRIPIAQRGIIVFIPEASSIERQVADLNNAPRNVSRTSPLRSS